MTASHDPLEALMKAKQYAAALDAARDLGQREPLNAWAPYYEGLALFYLQRDTEAIEAHQRAIALDPDHVPARYRLAEAQMYSGQSEVARASLVALSQRTDIPANLVIGVWATLGFVCRALRDDAATIDAWEHAVSLGSCATEILSGLAEKLVQKDPLRAQELWKRVLLQDPRHMNALYNLALNRQLAQEYEEALGLFKRAHEVTPMDSGVTRKITQCCNALGLLSEAGDWRARTLELLAGNPEAAKRNGPWLCIDQFHYKDYHCMMLERMDPSAPDQFAHWVCHLMQNQVIKFKLHLEHHTRRTGARSDWVDGFPQYETRAALPGASPPVACAWIVSMSAPEMYRPLRRRYHTPDYSAFKQDIRDYIDMMLGPA